MAEQPKEPIVGLDIQNSCGGVGMDIQNTGSLGAESVVQATNGQSVIGTRIGQTGPGIGMKIVQNGPGVGFRSVVTIRNEDKKD